MNKIIVTIAVSLAVLISVHLAAAQQTQKVYRIGFLMKRSGPDMEPRKAAFRQGLRDLGLVEGRNIEILYRSPDGRQKRLSALVADLLNKKVDVIVTLGGAPARAAMKATRTTPIVLAVASTYVARGYARSLRRPGGNVTGLSTMARDLMGKQLQLLKEVVPGLSRVAIIRVTGSHPELITQAKAAAPLLGLHIIAITVDRAADVPGAFRRMATERIDGVLVLRSGFLLRLKEPIVAHANQAGLPTMFGHREEVEAGGLMAYGADTNALFRGAAAYVDKILKGANPAEMPVSQATTFLLDVNLKTAKALGITFPRSILLRATKVVE